MRFIVQPIDFADLTGRSCRIESVRHGDATAVVGKGDVLVAPRLRRGRHDCDGGRAVGPVGVDMEIAADVGDGHETRQPVCLGGRYLAAVLAQFRLDECKTELLIDLRFGDAGNPPFAGKHTVLVQFPAVLVGEAAQRDVVSFGAGKIEQRGAVAPLRDGADIDLQARPQHDGGARGTVGENFSHIFIAHQLIADGNTIPGRYQNIEIADCIAAPAVAAGYDDAPAVAKIADNAPRPQLRPPRA